MRWLWIDRIIELEAGKRLVAIKNVSLAEEYLHTHLAGDREHEVPIMPASLMIEGMAQTSGILVGSVNKFREKVILAKIVSASFQFDVTPGDSIRYEATLERMDSVGASTHGIVKRRKPDSEKDDWQEIGRVELLFSHLDNNMAGMEFPEENFVFAENFRTLLKGSGFQTEIDAL